MQARLDGGDHALGDLVLESKEIRKPDVVALRPNLQAGRGIAQLRTYPKPLSGTPDAPVEDVAHAKVTPDLLHVDRLALIGEGRVAGRDEEPAKTRQARDNVLGKTICEN